MTNRPMTNRPMTNRPMTNRPMTNRPMTDRPMTNRPMTNRPRTHLSCFDYAKVNVFISRILPCILVRFSLCIFVGSLAVAHQRF